MARITAEDCLEKITNRFSLVMLAAKRSKQLLSGSKEKIENDQSNKEIVMALREIAAGHIRFMTPEEEKQYEEDQEREREERKRKAAIKEEASKLQVEGKSKGALDALFGDSDSGSSDSSESENSESSADN